MLVVYNKTGKEIPVMGMYIPANGSVKMPIIMNDSLKGMVNNNLISITEIDDEPTPDIISNIIKPEDTIPAEEMVREVKKSIKSSKSKDDE